MAIKQTSGASRRHQPATGQPFAGDTGIVNRARNEAAKAEITVRLLRGNISVLMGSGGNITVFSGPDGKLLVDAGIPASKPKIIEALAAISRDPIRYLINTHWHFDHTDGNQWVHDAGATIIAHENTRRHLSSITRVDDWDFTFPPLPRKRTADRSVQDRSHSRHQWRHHCARILRPLPYRRRYLRGVCPRRCLYHRRHVVERFLPLHRLFDRRQHQRHDPRHGSQSFQGHGQDHHHTGTWRVGDKSQLTEYRDMLVNMRDKVAAIKKQGMSLDEVLAAKPAAAYDARWGRFLIDGSFFTRLVYAGV